ncbi:hypothetical protein TRIUR3_21580 [Triticum urartu]|uniref:Uncharacterized protein n=1 Tax=Triticum urartu TaxID=4572 RepID=M7YPB7_TRIUA|nr:hypothetical protein TRIUR3_21580 [Triticum urartu]
MRGIGHCNDSNKAQKETRKGKAQESVKITSHTLEYNVLLDFKSIKPLSSGLIIPLNRKKCKPLDSMILLKDTNVSFLKCKGNDVCKECDIIHLQVGPPPATQVLFLMDEELHLQFKQYLFKRMMVNVRGIDINVSVSMLMDSNVSVAGELAEQMKLT